MKESVCAVLALSRVGLPIATPTVNYLIGYGENEAYQRMLYLSSYHIIEPTEAMRTGSGGHARCFRLTSKFIETVYSPLKEEETGNTLKTEGE